jgi:molecular chaperone DnaK
VDAAEKATLEAAIGRVKEALKGSDDTELQSAVSALEAAASKAGEKMYQAAGAGQPGAGGPGAPGGQEPPTPGKKGDGAVDADFEVVN